MFKIKITRNTTIKPNTKQSITLDPNSTLSTIAGTEYFVNDLTLYSNHYKFTMEGTEWYLYKEHCEVLGGKEQKENKKYYNLAIKIITEFEGERLQAYLCPAGVPTISIGLTVYPNGKKVRLGDKITKQQSTEYFLDYLDRKVIPVLSKIPSWRYMNDNQKAAIISFAFNLGSYFYRNSGFSSITRVCDERDKWKDSKWIEEQFTKYRNPGSSFEQGLLRRRKAEAKLFCS